MFLKYHRKKQIAFSKKIEFSCREKFYTFIDKDLKVILGGKFYYYNSPTAKTVYFSEDPKGQLKNLVKNYQLESFINSVEGVYWGVLIDYKNESLIIFSDKLKRLDLYYFYNDNVFIVSDDPREIVDEIGMPKFEKNSLISTILLYVPKGHSLFKGIYRLKYNETITIAKDKIFKKNLKDKDIKISKYSKKDLLRYNKIIRDSILSRASHKLNLVLCSGGWDSTMILAILSKYLGKDKVKAVIWKVIMSDGRCYNKFEVDKTKKLAKTLGIKVDIVEIDYRKRSLYCQSKEAEKDLFFRNLFFLSPANWANLVKFIKEKYGESTVVFNGEGVDSLHNYGFSQYISLAHDNKDFQQYSDKMKGYLFSPDFFKKIKDNSFIDDIVYKIFLNANQGKEFVDVKRMSPKRKIYYWLLSFVFSDVRIPFRKVVPKKYIRASAFRNFEEWLKKEYFQEAIEDINENNLYYWFSYLYTLFHLQSPELQIFRYGFENMRMPFVDLNLFKFLYKMPQDFGRGLEFKPTKYPLKELAKIIFSQEQIKIIESPPHSYLDEIEEGINIWNEYFLKGSWYEYMKDNIDYKKIRTIFDDKIFNVYEIENLIKRFKQGKIKNISSVEGGFLILLTLLST